jgi:hypothetical protein
MSGETSNEIRRPIRLRILAQGGGAASVLITLRVMTVEQLLRMPPEETIQEGIRPANAGCAKGLRKLQKKISSSG